MATKFAYYLFLLPLSYLPQFVLYRFSDLVYLVLVYIIRYRRSIITSNIEGSFPGKSSEELKQIRLDYYKHLGDIIVETISNFSVSKKCLEENFTFENIDLMEDLYAQGKSVIVMGGHYGNWERYAIAVGDQTRHKQLAIFKPFKNKFFDQKMKKARERYGIQMISMRMAKKYFIKNPDELKCITFAMDQWTPNAKQAYWTKFLQRDTSFFPAAELLAKEFNWAVIYCGLEKKKRGHYHATFDLISNDPQNTAEGEIMESFVKKLEASIQTNPPHWLWSHRRWKKTKEEVFNS